jgi:hypothetical protein
MKIRRLIAIFAIMSLGLFGAIILAQERVPAGETSDRVQHTRFDARDREIAGAWYRERRGDFPEGFREEDRLTPNSELRLRVGEALDPDLRWRIQPVPNDLLEKLPPPARDSRYVILDGHLLLVDGKTWNVSDVLHFELDFGRP